MRRFGYPAREQALTGCQMRLLDLSGEGLPRLLSNLKLYRPIGLTLHHHCAWKNGCALGDVADPQAAQVTATQLAVNGKVEWSQITGPVGKLVLFGSPRFLSTSAVPFAQQAYSGSKESTP